MRITRVTPVPISDRQPRPVCSCACDTDEGLHGWGKSGLTSRERAVAAAVEHYGGLAGRPRPDEHRRAVAGDVSQPVFRRRPRAHRGDVGGIDIAFARYQGKGAGRAGLAVARREAPRLRRHVRIGADARISAGSWSLPNSFSTRGWRCIRLPRKEGEPHGSGTHHIYEPWQSLGDDRRMDGPRCARRSVSRAIIQIDYHHRLSVAEAASFCQRMPPGTLDWIEEPRTTKRRRRLRSPAPDDSTPIPFALGEEFASKWQFLPYVERDIAQYARIDICNVGGFTEAMKVAGWCEAHYVDLMPHNPLGPVCTAATVHLAAAVPNFAWAECRETPGKFGFSPGFTDLHQPSAAGRCALPCPHRARPGHRYRYDQARRRRAARLFEFPHLRRDDGSHTNW